MGARTEGIDDDKPLRPIFVIRVRAVPGRDHGVRAVRALLKAAGRHYGLQAIAAYEEKPEGTSR